MQVDQVGDGSLDLGRTILVDLGAQGWLATSTNHKKMVLMV